MERESPEVVGGFFLAPDGDMFRLADISYVADWVSRVGETFPTTVLFKSGEKLHIDTKTGESLRRALLENS